MKGDFWLVRNEHQRERLIEAIRNQRIGDFGFQAQLSTGQRTPQQNKAIYKYFTLLADDLNARGLDMKKVLKESVTIEWNKDMVKKYLWSPIQKAVIGEASTTRLDRKQVSEVYEVLANHLATKFDVIIDFPHDDPPPMEPR